MDLDAALMRHGGWRGNAPAGHSTSRNRTLSAAHFPCFVQPRTRALGNKGHPRFADAPVGSVTQ